VVNVRFDAPEAMAHDDPGSGFGTRRVQIIYYAVQNLFYKKNRRV
jgi:hypothetical protein